MSRDALAGRRALVMGLGRFGGGVGATRFLAARGARVTVTDLRSADELEEGLAELEGLEVELVLGEHKDEDFRSADLVVPNPAVPPGDARLALARAAGARVVSAMELFLDRTEARVVCVTGTQGKSSTSSMIAQLLEVAGLPVRLGGNIGGSLLPEVDSIGPDEVCVLEVSSYQLEALSADEQAGRAEVVAITNVLSDHLERHGTPAAYARAKARVLELVGDGGTAFFPTRSQLDLHKDVVFEPGAGARVVRVGPGGDLRVADGLFRFGEGELGHVEDLTLPGAFQVENALLALGVARTLGAAPDRLGAAVSDLRGIPHRMELVGIVRGHPVWDNGVSTTPDSTVSALASLDGRCVLVLGGLAKRGLPLSPLVGAARERVRHAIAFGSSAARFAEALAEADVPTTAVEDVGAAVRAAFEEAHDGEPVLFSPACASFDAYPNFLERARDFRERIEAMR